MPLRINGGSSDSCVVDWRGGEPQSNNNNNVIIATAIEAAAVDILFNSIRADVDAVTAVPSTVNSA